MDAARFPDDGSMVPDLLSKLEAARWLRLHEPVTSSVMAELAGGPLVEDGPQVNVVDVADIWARGLAHDPFEPLSEVERKVWADVAQRMVYKVEYLIRRHRIKAIKVGKEHQIHIDELRRFVRSRTGHSATWLMSRMHDTIQISGAGRQGTPNPHR